MPNDTLKKANLSSSSFRLRCDFLEEAVGREKGAKRERTETRNKQKIIKT